MTVLSVNVTLPVPVRAGTGPSRVKVAPPSVDRSTTKPVSLLALSRQVNATRVGPACGAAASWLGAAGAFTPTSGDDDLAETFGNAPP